MKRNAGMLNERLGKLWVDNITVPMVKDSRNVLRQEGRIFHAVNATLKVAKAAFNKYRPTLQIGHGIG
ncbi:MAG TPA: hypothetical protein VMC85_20520 [Desulfomonilaceae bacterium]|nr:hypothetical protein [Desulfomonilaceae bacterium]